VLASPSQFDFEKLTWLNSQYIMEMDDQQLMKLFRNELATVYDVDSQDDAAWWKSFVQAFKERVRTLAEIRERAAFLFVDEVSIDWSHKKTRKTLRKPEALQSLRDIAAELEKLSEWSPAAIDHIVEAYTEKAGISPGLVGQPVRIAVTGGPVSPGIGETVFLLGRDKTLARLYCAIEEIAAKQAEEA
jgi:glutamyl-tRNA synthetase